MIRCYTRLSTTFKRYVQHTIHLYIKCQDVQTYNKCKRGGVREEKGWWGVSYAVKNAVHNSEQLKPLAELMSDSAVLTAPDLIQSKLSQNNIYIYITLIINHNHVLVYYIESYSEISLITLSSYKLSRNDSASSTTGNHLTALLCAHQ